MTGELRSVDGPDPPPPGEPEPLIDAAEAGRLLGVPKTWVLAQARAGRIPHVRLGRYVRFEATELRRWRAGRRRGPGSSPSIR